MFETLRPSKHKKTARIIRKTLENVQKSQKTKVIL